MASSSRGDDKMRDVGEPDFFEQMEEIKSAIAGLPANNRHQAILVSKINAYLKMKNREYRDQYTPDEYKRLERPLIPDNAGFCFALTLLWGYKKANNDTAWFYNIIKKICSCPDNELETIELEIEKLYGHIQWLQNIEQYLPDQTYGKKDIGTLIEGATADYIALIFSNDNELQHYLSRYVQAGSIVMFRNDNNTYPHIVGVSSEGHCQFELYDSNYGSGEAKKIGAQDNLFDQIKSQLYTKFNLQPGDKLTSYITVIKFPKMKLPYDAKVFKHERSRNADADIADLEPRAKTPKLR